MNLYAPIPIPLCQTLVGTPKFNLVTLLYRNISVCSNLLFNIAIYRIGDWLLKHCVMKPNVNISIL